MISAGKEPACSRNFRSTTSRRVGTMDPTAVVRAMEALMSPLEWGTQDAWLAESLSRVRHALGRRAWTGELDVLLRLENDEPGWLQTALDSAGWTGAAKNALPVFAADS